MANGLGSAKIRIAAVTIVVVVAAALAWVFLPLLSGSLGGQAGAEKARLSLQYVYPSLDRIKVLNAGPVDAAGVFVAIGGSRVEITRAECFEVASGSLSEKIVSCPNFGNDLAPGQSKILTLARKVSAGKTLELGCNACGETGTQLSQRVHVLP